MIRFGVYQHGIGWSYEQLKDFWVEAEQLGFYYAWMMDNNVFKDPRTGEWLPVFEPWTVLPALAEATNRIRMGPMVTPCRRRHPALLAKITSIFDQISNGRLELGLGTGGGEEDSYYWTPWGMTFPKHSVRIAILREEIEILKRMWTEKEANFQGKYYTLTNANNDPKPIQKPHPPIWIGIVLGKRAMPKLAAEVADGINLYNASDVAIKELLAAVEGYCKDLGRDFDTIQKSRSVNVILTEGEVDLSQPDAYTNAFGTFPHVIGTSEELAREMATTIDEQHQRMRDAKEAREKLDEYSRITERHVIGAPEQVATELREIAADGFDQLIIHGLDTIEELRRFAEEVMPYV